jgi:hypothetical protein
MPDHATPNLPSRNFAITADFYAKFGFQERFRDEGWMILERAGLVLEFFPYPDLDPATSNFSGCLRLNNVTEFFALLLAQDIRSRHHRFRSFLPRFRSEPGWRGIFLTTKASNSL